MHFKKKRSQSHCLFSKVALRTLTTFRRMIRKENDLSFGWRNTKQNRSFFWHFNPDFWTRFRRSGLIFIKYTDECPWRKVNNVGPKYLYRNGRFIHTYFSYFSVILLTFLLFSWQSVMCKIYWIIIIYGRLIKRQVSLINSEKIYF